LNGRGLVAASDRRADAVVGHYRDRRERYTGERARAVRGLSVLVVLGRGVLAFGGLVGSEYCALRGEDSFFQASI